MTTEDRPASDGALAAAERTADRLAVALEDVGFDVGRAFPVLNGGVDRRGHPIVDLGRVAEPVAFQLATVLARAAASGATSAPDEPTAADG
jgi:hypothetical protein